MKKSLLTLALLTSSLAGSTAVKAYSFDEISTVLGFKNLFIDVSYVSESFNDATVQGDFPNALASNFKFSYENSGVRVGVKKYFARNNDESRAFFVTPYLFFGNTSFELNYGFRNGNNSNSEVSFSNLSTSTNALGVELGVTNNSSSSIFTYVAVDLSKNISDYQALATGAKLGLGLRTSFAVFHIDIGWRYTFKSNVKGLNNSYYFKDVNNSKYAVKGFNSMATYFTSFGFSF